MCGESTGLIEMMAKTVVTVRILSFVGLYPLWLMDISSVYLLLLQLRVRTVAMVRMAIMDITEIRDRTEVF